MRARRAVEASELNDTFADLRAFAPQFQAPANDDLDAALAGREHIVPADVEPVSDASVESNLVTPRRRARLAKSGLRDREDAEVRRAYRRGRISPHRAARRAAIAQTSNSTPGPHNDNHTPSKDTKGKAGRKKSSRARFIAPWNDAGERTRIDYINRAVMLRGVPYEISLHLSHDRIAAANENDRGPLDDLWRDINRRLAKALPDLEPALWVSLETTKDEARLHIHGGIAITSPRQLPAIRDALKAAGGAWTGSGSQYQLRLVPQEQPDAYAAYATKHGAQTRGHLREALGLHEEAPVKIVAWSRSLLRGAKRLLEEERRAIGRR